MKALIFRPKGQSLAVEDVPVPVPGPKQILVRVQAVALNTVDVMNLDHPLAVQDTRVVGSDFVGVVAAIGEDLKSVDDPRAVVGARVAGFVQGANSGNDRPGAYAEYVVADYDLTWSVAANVPLENAATVNLCGLTAAQGLFYRMGFPCPFYGTPTFEGVEEPVNVLIYGSTTNVGLFAAQLVRIAEKTAGKKIRLIGAASASKHAMLREAPYQYDVLVDYKKSSWTEEALQATGGSGVLYAIDAVSSGPTVANVESTLSANGKFAAYRTPNIGNFDMAALKIKPVIGAVWEGLGVEIEYHGVTLLADQEARKFAAAFFKFIGQSTASDLNVPQSVPIRLMPGGIEKIVSGGFSVLRQSPLASGDGSQRSMEAHLRPVSAEKLVYKI
ncbi:chaperonin 10-like protein [Ilyonectria robusta]|uniref:chaperonin 10-like protein n=1 Tax=Ilyonectria robusta TaxID=1079257 RepID=UPI001E8E5D2E|nr:chaperonin 10-like protein [Ilyonectria robusta]KAH8688503.1 chaperonin 10-like protein [Ilyonectria robusta]